MKRREAKGLMYPKVIAGDAVNSETQTGTDIKSPNKSLLSLTKGPEKGSLARQKILDNKCFTPGK